MVQNEWMFYAVAEFALIQVVLYVFAGFLVDKEKHHAKVMFFTFLAAFIISVYAFQLTNIYLIAYMASYVLVIPFVWKFSPKPTKKNKGLSAAFLFAFIVLYLPWFLEMQIYLALERFASSAGLTKRSKILEEAVKIGNQQYFYLKLLGGYASSEYNGYSLMVEDEAGKVKITISKEGMDATKLSKAIEKCWTGKIEVDTYEPFVSISADIKDANNAFACVKRVLDED